MNDAFSPVPGLVVSERTHLSLPSDPGLVEAAAEFLKQHAELCGACSPSRSGKLMIVFVEVLTNAIVHGNLELSSQLKERGDSSFAHALALRASDPHLAARRVDILVDYDGSTCRWTITDEGKGFDVESALKRLESDDPEVILASGRGLLIMRSFLDDVRWDWGGRRIIMTLERANGAEKRGEPRLPLNHRLRVAPLKADGSVDWDAAYEAVARDLSSGGIAILQHSLRHADRVLVGLPVEGQMVYVPAQIKHVQSVSGDMVQLGCRFDVPMSSAAGGGESADEALQRAQAAIGTMLDSLSSGAAPEDERRAFTRLAFSEGIEIRAPQLPAPIRGYARDLSRGGIAFVANVRVPDEVTLVFRPRTDGPSLMIRSQVVRCTQVMDGLFDVGAKFLSLADSVAQEIA